MCTQSELHTILREIYEKSLRDFGDKLDAVILYGSYARGDYDEESDIDVMVRVKVSKQELHQYMDTFVHFTGELGMEHNVFISFHLQDFATFNEYKDALPFYRNIIKDGVQIGA